MSTEDELEELTEMTGEEQEEMKKRIKLLARPVISCDYPVQIDVDFMSLAVKAYKLGFEAGANRGYVAEEDDE